MTLARILFLTTLLVCLVQVNNCAVSVQSSLETIVWQDQDIILDNTPVPFENTALIVDNCTVHGGASFTGNGTIEITNTEWVLENASDSHSGYLLYFEEEVVSINVTIRNSTIISNGTGLFYIPQNVNLYIENSIIKDIYNYGSESHEYIHGGILLFDDGSGIHLTINNCTMSSILRCFPGDGTSTVNITHSKFDYAIATYGTMVDLNRLSSVNIQDNEFSGNCEVFIESYLCKEIIITNNSLTFNDTQVGFSHMYSDVWTEEQVGVKVVGSHSNVIITNNTFSNLGTAARVGYNINEKEKTLFFEDNTLREMHHEMVTYSGGIGLIRNNIFFRCHGPMYLGSRGYKVLVHDNLFNNSGEMDGRPFSGIVCYGCHELNVTENVFIGGESQEYPNNIVLDDVNRSLIAANNFESKYIRGFHVSNGRWLEIARNNFTNEIVLLYKVDNGTIYLNQFLNESMGYQLNSSDVLWHNGTHGNYWESFQNIRDENGDLVGDSSFIGSSTTADGLTYNGAYDSYPLTAKFFGKEGPSTPISSSDAAPTSEKDDTGSLSHTLSESKISDDTNSIGWGVVVVLLGILSIRRLKRRTKVK